MTCSEAVRRLWDYLESDLGADDRERITSHLALCRRCCGEVEFTEALRALLRSAAVPTLPPSAERQLVGFLDALGQEPHP